MEFEALGSLGSRRRGVFGDSEVAIAPFLTTWVTVGLKVDFQ